jgi:hypothetical protein
MFKQQGQGTFIPTKSVEVKPEAQVDYDPITQTQVRFLLPQYLGFIDPKECRLQYKLQMSGRGRPQPSSRAGVHSLWRDFRIQDGTGQTTIEEIQDYDVLTAQWWGYTQNHSISSRRTMFEGKSETPAVGDSLYYGRGLDWASGVVTDGLEAKTLEIEQPLYSGILSSDKVFPLLATQGLRLQMTLDNLSRSLVYQTGTLGVQESTAAPVSAVELKVVKNIGDDSKGAIGDEFSCVVRQPSDAGSGRGVFRNATPYNNCPFDIGDRLYVSAAADMEVLGVITKFGKDGAGDLEISYIPERANGVGLAKAHAIGSPLYVLSGERLSGYTAVNVPAAQIAEAAKKVSYTISDIQWILGVVSPPEGYVKAMTDQMASSKGLAFDFKTYSTYRVNLTATNGLTNQLIPATAMRAYSVLSVPLGQTKQLKLEEDSLAGLIDGCQNYQYVLGGHLIPDRPIKLDKYTETPSRVDALHLIELEKSLVNCGYGVRDIQRVPEKFLIGRAFSKYGQVSDLNTRDLSLRVEYTGATEQKLFNHYVCHIRRLQVQQGRVSAF